MSFTYQSKCYHDGPAGEHYSINTTIKNIFTIGYWWLTIQQDVVELCMEVAQLILVFEPFMKWRLDYMGLIKPLADYIGNIIIAIDYTTKWVEAKALRDKTTISTVENLYENIIRRFDCPTHLVGD